MKANSRPALIALTHCVAIAVGWAVYQASGFQSVGNISIAPPSARTKSTDRATADVRSGEEILAPILASVEMRHKGMRTIDDPGADNAIPQTRQDILDRIASIDLPEDFAKALDLLDAKPSKKNTTEMAALAFHWMNQDSKAFFDWLRAGPKQQGPGIGISLLFQLEPEIYRRSGVEGVIAQMANAEGFKHQISSDLGRSLAKSRDLAGIVNAKQLLVPDPHTPNSADWRSLVKNIGTYWPNDKSGALIQLAADMDEPMLLIGHKQNIEGYGSYIAGILSDESLSEDFRRKISENPTVRAGMTRDSSLPLETRLQNGGDVQEIIYSDVGKLLGSERDWAFAFRNGQATAEEIMTVVAAGTPELAKSQPEALRMHVFRELAEENPSAAMDLLKDLPDDKRSELALFASRTHFNDVEPSKFLELLEQIPSDTPEQWDGRLDAWNRRSFTNNERLQDGYVDWVQALAPGLDREMALYSLARAVDAKDPKLASDLRNQVSDPELKKRIAKHR